MPAGSVPGFPLLAIAVGLGVSAALAGCLVGPDYKAPEPELPAAWSQEPAGGLSLASADPARWWTRLGDPLLDSLVERAVSGNLERKQAIARIEEARARRGIVIGDALPTIDARAAFSRSYRSANATTAFGSDSPRKIDNYSGGFDAGWELDLFGGWRRALEAADAELAASDADLRDVEVSLTAELVQSYVELRSAQTRLRLARENLALQRDTLDNVSARFQAGLATDLDVAQAQTVVESTAASIPRLEALERAAMNRIDVLAGLAPGSTRDELAEAKPIPAPMPEVAVGVPADLLRRRPDLRRAERGLAAETARIGMAAAELYPRLKLAGNLGLSAADASNLFSGGSTTHSWGPSFSWRIFQGGAIRAAVAAQDARSEQALAAYEQAVLRAMEETENAMNAFVNDQLRRAALERAEAGARRALEGSTALYEEGLARFDRVLDSQRALVEIQDQLALSGAEVSSDLIALFKAMGGGW